MRGGERNSNASEPRHCSLMQYVLMVGYRYQGKSTTHKERLMQTDRACKSSSPKVVGVRRKVQKSRRVGGPTHYIMMTR